MKPLKIVLSMIGLVALVAAGFYLVFVGVTTGQLLSAANANKSANLLPSPMTNVYITTVLAAGGGLLLGLGVGMPIRTRGQVRRAALDQAAQKRTDEIGSRAAGNGNGPGPEAA
ncbi:MAG: hypothetical protein ACK5LN_01715 [Propioniciclava sp.]